MTPIEWLLRVHGGYSDHLRRSGGRALTWMIVCVISVWTPFGLAAGEFTSREAEMLTAAARANPRDAGSQQIIDLVGRLGKAHNTEALDHLIALKHEQMIVHYMRAFRENYNRPVPAIEELLLRNYDEPRLAISLFGGLDRYNSPALGDRLIDDVAQLAAFRRERALRCRVVLQDVLQEIQPTDPHAQPMGQFGIASRTRMTRLECAPPMPPVPVEVFRRERALLLVGDTDLPGVAERVAPHIRDLVSAPHLDEVVKNALGTSGPTGTISSLRSVARLMGERRHQAAAPDLIAALEQLDGKTRGEFEVAWPLLQALGQMDLRKGTETIARWIERRSVSTFSLQESPLLWQMIGLLAPVLPEGQIDIGPLRDRVLENIPYAALKQHSGVFRGVETANRGLRDPTGSTLVAWAGSGNARMVRYVLSKGVPIDARNAEGDTSLTAAAPHYFEVQKLLVETGANPDLPGRAGRTPFHIAVGWFNPRAEEPFKIVDYFLAHGADVNSMTTGQTPLHTAAASHVELVRHLIAHGARVNAETKEGVTPLHTAATSHVEIVRYLIANGARVNAKTKNRMMPLHIAVKQGNVEIAAALLENGAQVNAEISDGVADGLTPLQIARDAKNASMEALLLRYGGTVNAAYLAKREAAMKLLFGPGYRSR